VVPVVVVAIVMTRAHTSAVHEVISWRQFRRGIKVGM
jgi:hypothetical protein